MRSMVEGACGAEAGREADAPSTTLLRSAVPLSRFAGQDDETRCRRISARASGNPAWAPAPGQDEKVRLRG